MPHAEEIHAKALCKKLRQTLAPLGAEVSVTGNGVHWTCAASRGERASETACFDTRGPQYLVSLAPHPESEITGRTRSDSDVIAATHAWLQGSTLTELYGSFGFIDQCKRSLEAIRDKAIGYHSELAQCTKVELLHVICDIWELWLKARDRCCRINFHGEDDTPRAAFQWDECHLFEVRTRDVEQLALVLKRWLCDYAKPSEVAHEFPWVSMRKAAQYYEEGRGVEGEFVASWDALESFYGEEKAKWRAQALALIAQMRQKGFDKVLRAGQSMWTMVLSRSRRHGLRMDQPRITIDFRDDGMDIRLRIGPPQKLFFSEIRYTTEIEAILRQLEAKSID